MADRTILINRIDEIHTTELGKIRIRKNLKLDIDNIVEYCKNKILNENSIVYSCGKNWYCEVENIKLTINKNTFTIITAHIIY